ncbi:MAG: 2-oxoglutarate dehydrogenase complex dihydrolipoyllysine-residue succinyltransferase [Pseudomarimonas sp.]
MSTEVKVPVLPESVSDAVIATWHKKAGDAVKRDENLLDLETDKVVLEVPSPVDGVLREIRFQAGDTVTSQQVVAIIDAGASAAVSTAATPAAVSATAPAASAAESATSTEDLSPAGRRVAEQHSIDPAAVSGSGRDGRVTKEDLISHMRSGGEPAKVAPAAAPAKSAPTGSATPAAAASIGARAEQRVPMTRIRQRIAERLMESKNSIAMLTSSNEINLREVMAMRKLHGEAFEKSNGVKLGFMSFFVKAAASALQRYPVVNASVDGTDVIYHGFSDISIAVATEKGLVTPVLRNAEAMSFADIEKAIGDYAKKARDGKLSLDDLQGGTFTITNGGTFGSLFSTPIVNPPQSAILGMHAIKDRAIVENGVVVAAPMMYIALSYDHRIIDGKDAVLFLVAVKNFLEDPMRLMLHL